MDFNKNIIWLTLALSVISFPAAALAVLIWIFSSKENWSNRNARIFVYIVISFSISWLNTSKPTYWSDLAYYYGIFRWARTVSLVECITLMSKEPIYHIYSYMMNYILFDHFPTFITVTSMLMYLLVFLGNELILCSQDGIDMRYGIIASLILVFFVEYFFYTAHIVRQVLAGSVAFYGLAQCIFVPSKRKLSIGIVMVAGFIHASAFIFMMFLVPYMLRHRMFIVQAGVSLIILIMYTIVLKFIGTFDIDSETINVAVSRGTQKSGDNVSVGLLPFLICISALPMSMWLIFRNWRTLKLLEDVNVDVNMETYFNDRCFFISICIIPLFLILNRSNQFFVLRFMVYDYILLPILIVLIFSKYKRGMAYSLGVLLFLAIRFTDKFGSGNFSYMDLSDYLVTGWWKTIL